jgi:hypothetical protein
VTWALVALALVANLTTAVVVVASARERRGLIRAVVARHGADLASLDRAARRPRRARHPRPVPTPLEADEVGV